MLTEEQLAEYKALKKRTCGTWITKNVQRWDFRTEAEAIRFKQLTTIKNGGALKGFTMRGVYLPAEIVPFEGSFRVNMGRGNSTKNTLGAD